ncbi:MAG: hypothetical protein EA413_09705 [Cyanobium sp. PLM2.Bin73]|nr:MAG: hypothetical protein EA413_09705 [Cyanobium sp. PLM2.Bin73]
MALLIGAIGPAALAEPWKTCAFNDQPIRCRDSHSLDGTVRIAWEREVLIQGNTVFTNPANGNRIFVPLR